MKTPSIMELHALSPIKWVEEERRRQHMARGEQNHNALKWFTILSEEFGEVARALEHRTEAKSSLEEYKRELEYELIQVAAVAVAWVEAIRRDGDSGRSPICVCLDCSKDAVLR